MSPLPPWLAAPRVRAFAGWLVPALALGALIGWETDWGRHVLRVPEPPPPVAPRPASSSVLPEYRLEGGLVARSETVNRTLFNPTRRPAPSLAAEEGGPRRIQRGQFQLVGTAVSDERNIAFLKETSGGKGRVVRQGDDLNGMQVAVVGRDRVLLVAGAEKEELLLKSAPSPLKTTPAPPPPGVPGAGTVVPPGAPGVPPAPVAGRNGQPLSPQQQTRRAARQAAAAAAAASHEVTPGAAGAPEPMSAQPPTPAAVQPATPGAAAGAGPPAQSDASWEAVYRRMQQGK